MDQMLDDSGSHVRPGYGLSCEGAYSVGSQIRDTTLSNLLSITHTLKWWKSTIWFTIFGNV